MFEKEIAITTLNAVGNVAGRLRNLGTDNLAEYTRDTRVEPITIVESNLRHVPLMPDLMQALTSTFAAYYLQAVSLSVNVGKVSPGKLLRHLSTDQNPNDAVLDFIGAESYQFKLPDYSNISVEAGAAKGASRDVDLRVGRMFDVEIESDGARATIPMMLRLNTKHMNTKNLLHILSLGSKDNSTSARYHKWRAGELEFMKDLILCQDMIDAHKEALLEDQTGLYEKMLKRNRKGRIASVLSGKPSANSASGVMVISQETADRLERETGAKLSNFRKREKLFKDAFIMMLAVVDTEWDQVTLYTRGIDTETELSERDLKQTNKGSGPDVAEILKAYQLGNAPAF